jgi:integrase
MRFSESRPRRAAFCYPSGRHRVATQKYRARTSQAMTRREQPSGKRGDQHLSRKVAALNEVSGLEWSFIDVENGSVRLPDAKSGRRTVPLGITTVELLKNASRSGKFVCCGFEANEMPSEATFRGFWDRMRSRRISELLFKIHFSVLSVGLDPFWQGA